MKELFFAAAFAVAAYAQPDMAAVLEHLDQLYRSDNSHAEMTMHIVTDHWERTLEMEAWSEGSDRTFIVVHAPAREAGSATLRLGSEMWNYLPNTNSTIRIPPSMMTGSWMGSDLTNNDMVKEITYSSDYTGEYIDRPAGTSAEGELLYLRLTPEPSTAVVWAWIECAVSRDPLLPVWEEYYDSHGDLIKTVTFTEVENMDGRIIPTVMSIIPADKEGQSTTVTWSNASFNRGVDQDVFSLANLQTGGDM